MARWTAGGICHRLYAGCHKRLALPPFAQSAIAGLCAPPCVNISSLSQDRLILCAISFGYADEASSGSNRFRTPGRARPRRQYRLEVLTCAHFSNAFTDASVTATASHRANQPWPVIFVCAMPDDTKRTRSAGAKDIAKLRLFKDVAAR